MSPLTEAMIINGVVLFAVLESDLGPHRKISRFRVIRPFIVSALVIVLFLDRPVTHGNGLLVELAGTGDLVGYADFADTRGERSQLFGAQALTNSCVALFTRHHIAEVLKSLDAETLIKIASALNTMWSSVTYRYASFLGMSLRKRLEFVLNELAERFGTPAYLVDEAGLRHQARRMREGLAARYPDSEVVFASKSFPCLAVYKLFATEGLSIDVAGEPYEPLQQAQNAAWALGWTARAALWIGGAACAAASRPAGPRPTRPARIWGEMPSWIWPRYSRS